MNEKIVIRELREEDALPIHNAFAAQGWDKPESQYSDYWRESLDGRRVTLVADFEGQFAGYLTIVWQSGYPPFEQAGIPEIVDFNVLIKFRRMKIGTALMDEAERRIAARSAVAGIGVCLHVDYGAAQVLYARRGYVPDGRGAFYQGRFTQGGDPVILNDDLSLQLTKRLGDG